MNVYLYASVFQLGLVRHRALLVGKHSNHHAVDINTHRRDIVYHTLDLAAVGYSVVGAHFIAFYSVCVYTYNQFGLIAQLLKQLYLCALVKAGQNPRRVQIVKQLASELQIQLIEAAYALQYVFRLLTHIHITVKSDFKHIPYPLYIFPLSQLPSLAKAATTSILVFL